MIVPQSSRSVVLASGAWRWVWQRRFDSPLVVLSIALGLGLYWVAVQEGWLAVGWRPALATTLIYLTGLAAAMGALTGGVELLRRLMERGLSREPKADHTCHN